MKRRTWIPLTTAAMLAATATASLAFEPNSLNPGFIPPSQAETEEIARVQADFPTPSLNARRPLRGEPSLPPRR